MFNASTKEAIKAAFSIVIAICLALWFQWEKPYWAAIAVAVMALNESFAHSINKGHNRLMGTLLGIGYAFFPHCDVFTRPIFVSDIFYIVLRHMHFHV
ncbi:FUSC family protein [Vibrio splendidus]|uniref:FUSC family protein n=1 Tax=Vibrio splendidus TaxID=29497 RepID=UPI0039A44C09